MTVQARQNHDVGPRELANESAAHFAVNCGERLGSSLDGFEALIDCGQELVTKLVTPFPVPGMGVADVRLGGDSLLPLQLVANLGPASRRPGVLEMRRQPPVKFHALSLGDRKGIGPVCDAVPEGLDEMDPLLDAEIRELFKLAWTHAEKSTQTTGSTQSRTHDARRQRQATHDARSEGASTVRCGPVK